MRSSIRPQAKTGRVGGTPSTTTCKTVGSRSTRAHVHTYVHMDTHTHTQTIASKIAKTIYITNRQQIL